MGGQRLQRLIGRVRPPREMPFREALEAQPEALPIVDEEFESGCAPVAKQEDGAGERVTVELVATQCRERINTFAKIDRLKSEHDGELWGKLDHDLRTKKSCAQGFELGRVSRGQMKCQARAVGTLEEQAGMRGGSRCVVRRKISSAQLQEGR